MTIEKYTPEAAREWDAHVAHSRNGTFLLERPYMDYHADRFTDCSRIIRSSSGDIIALLPASLHTLADGTRQVRSHGGLTYGGLIYGHRAGAAQVMQALDMAVQDLRESEGAASLLYKPTPHIYHTYPAEEDLYWLWRRGATVKVRNLSAAIDLQGRPSSSMMAKRIPRWQRQHDLAVTETHRAGDFWQLLADNLLARHGAAIVHTEAELQLLHDRFPAQIRFFTAQASGNAPAGAAVVYDTGTVAHVQYWGTTPHGKEMHAEEVIARHLIEDVFAARRWFDIGTSNENDGLVLNAGLQEHKERYGARGVVYDTYLLPLQM